jgi:hypothetical protein
VAEPSWTPAPAEPIWTPAAPAADIPRPAPAPEPAVQPDEPLTPAGGGASWSIVGADVPAAEQRAPKDGKKQKGKEKESEQAAGGSPWQLASGNAPSEEGADDGAPHKPSAAMALAQYAVLVVGLVMVLIGVLVMVANSKVT